MTTMISRAATLMLHSLSQDYKPLRRIQLRAVLEHIQSLFEQEIEAPSQRKRDNFYSRRWRIRLNEIGHETVSRIALARSLLSDSAKAKFKSIIDCDESMSVICQQTSPIKLTADGLAHSYGNNAADISTLHAAIAGILTDPVERRGMEVILSSLSTLRFPG